MTQPNHLYQELILDHNRSPRNFRPMDDADRQAEGQNPLCGDRITVWLKLDGDVVSDVSFQGSGCAISRASASLMTAAVKGKTREQIAGLFASFHDVVTGRVDAERMGNDLGKLGVFSGVSAFPVRVKCATLAWHALKAALHAESSPVSTD